MEDDAPGREINLLVVHNESATLAAMCGILETAGFKVKTATNGEDALELFRKQRPDLILSAIAMPNIDGIKLFEAVRSLPEVVQDIAYKKTSQHG